MISGLYSIADYNERVSSAHIVRQNVSTFRAIANTASDPAERQRYAEAAIEAEKFAPVIEAQARSIADSLGIDDTLYGKLLSPEQYDEYLRNGKKKDGVGTLGQVLSLKA